MISGIIGRKMGMTQLFAEDGTVTPVTVIKAGPCVVVQTKSAAGRDGYNAVQLGLVEDKPVRLKNVTKPLRGHFEKTGGGLPPTRVLKEIRLTGEPEAAIGDQIKVDLSALVPTWRRLLVAQNEAEAATTALEQMKTRYRATETAAEITTAMLRALSR